MMKVHTGTVFEDLLLVGQEFQFKGHGGTRTCQILTHQPVTALNFRGLYLRQVHGTSLATHHFGDVFMMAMQTANFAPEILRHQDEFVCDLQCSRHESSGHHGA